MAEIFVSYTSQDKAWAEWIAWTLNSAGHVARLHNWEIGGGGDILKWMEDRFEAADHLVSVISAVYLTKPYSALERRAAIYDDPEGVKGLWRPVLIEECKLPRLVAMFKRLPLYHHAGDRDASRKALLEFIEPAKAPIAEPPYPGTRGAAGVRRPEPAFPGTAAAAPPGPMAPAPAEPHLFPPDPVMIGRTKEEADLVAAILTDRTPVIIPGGPGMGKTTLAVSAAHDPAVAARFEERRYFVPLDAISSADAMVRAVAIALGTEATGSMAAVLGAIRERCKDANRLVVLDNLETPLERDQRQTEDALGHLSATGGLALVITVRGGLPALPKAEVFADVAPLPFEDAKQLFLRYAVGIPADDPDLANLLRALDGHALSIRLLGAVAEGQPNLALLRRAWQQKRAELLQEGEGDHRLRSTRASLRLSLESPRMTTEGRRLVALLALLPGGLAEDDLDAVLPGAGDLAALSVTRLRLASRREGRLRMLAPLRETAAKEMAPEQADLDRLIDLVDRIVCDAERGLREAKPELRAAAGREAENLDTVLLRAVEGRPPSMKLMNFARALGLFHSFTGLGSTGAIKRLADRAHGSSDASQIASCAQLLGYIALGRSDHDGARARFEEALPLYRKVGSVLGEANCIQSLGDIALERSDHESARARFEEALPLYRKVGDVLGEANCIKSLGNIALERSDHDGARARFEEALALYRQVGDVLGEANCIKSLGNIAFERYDHGGARARFEEALPLYRKVGAVLGEANCIRSLGDIALGRSDHDGARARFEEALPLYRKVGAVLGEANCIKSLGDIARERGDPDGAAKLWSQALELYGRIPEPYSMGHAHRRLARVAKVPEERVEHLAAARQAWRSIGRQDLVEKFVPENEA